MPGVRGGAAGFHDNSQMHYQYFTEIELKGSPKIVAPWRHYFRASFVS